MEITERGCVYFFRHIGLSPVKIGYSTNENPISRFDSFKTYAPYGAEILGFIMIENAKDLELILHERFSASRLKGEWFEISKEDVEKVVLFYSNIEDIKEKNEFEIQWAKHKNKGVKENLGEYVQKFDLIFHTKEDLSFYRQRKVINQRDLISFLGFDKRQLMYVINFYGLKISTHWDGQKLKKGYLLFEK